MINLSDIENMWEFAKIRENIFFSKCIELTKYLLNVGV